MNIRRLFQRFWTVADAVSVRTKILGIVLGLVLLLGLGITVQVRQALTQTMETQLEQQSVSMTRDLAARATDLILIRDLYALHQLLVEMPTNNSDVRYAFVVDPQGRILANTFGTAFPEGLVEANSARPDEHHRTVVLNTDEGLVWDTAVPIFAGRAGTARVGLSKAGVNQAVDAVTGQLLLTTVFVSVVGIAAAALLTWILTRPILALAEAAQAVGHGDFRRRIKRWADDEIGDLAEAFNAMTADLGRAAQERAEREQLRAEYVKGIIAAQEEERKRIARELHDDASQALTSLRVGLKTLTDICDDPELHRRVADLQTIAAQTMQSIHDLALQLRPSVLDDLGLVAALERHLADCRRRYGLTIDFAAHGLSDTRLAPTIETALYRIVQEALTNIGRHAHAHTVSVLLERRDGRVVAVIEDDGVGFDPGAADGAGRRLGLFGMQERAALLGGRFTVESMPGRGTSIFVEVPLKEG